MQNFKQKYISYEHVYLPENWRSNKHSINLKEQKDTAGKWSLDIGCYWNAHIMIWWLHAEVFTHTMQAIAFMKTVCEIEGEHPEIVGCWHVTNGTKI